MSTSLTVVTGLYNIKRETNGDGRKINDYIMWLKKTMRLNVPMVIYCEQSTYEEIKDQRSDYQDTKFIVIEKKLSKNLYQLSSHKMKLKVNLNN